MSTRILIVVDEPHYGEYLGDWLSRQGHEVKTASTAHDAIDCGAAWRPHVLVADWMLKESLNGVQVSAAIREANPAVQTILVHPTKAYFVSWIPRIFSLRNSWSRKP